MRPFVLLVSALFACGDNSSQPGTTDAAVDPDVAAIPDASPDAAVETGACATTIPATTGELTELCTLPAGGTVRHVRIAGVTAPAVHASAQIWFGYDAAPTSATAPLAADQFKVMLYGGGPPGAPTIVQGVFGTREQTIATGQPFVNQVSTVCFDLSDGSVTTAPAFVLWVDGQNGADCDAKSTLTIANALGVRARWSGPGAIAKAKKLFFRQSPGITATPTVTLSATPALAEAAVLAATQCTSTWTANTDWQQLCTPPAGKGLHVQLKAVASAANNSYWYAVIGQDAAPTGNPTMSPGKLIVTGGRSNSGSSWTYFRFDDGSTTQFTYSNTAGELYTAAASDVCFDLGSTTTGNARLVFWATGANAADCANRTTLTPATALYDSTTDAASGAIWDMPWVAGKLNFVKTNNPNVTLTDAVITSEPAAL